MEIPLRVALLGNVDSGKTTLMSVLFKNQLDNGNGFARKSVFKHPHEKETGRTSCMISKYFKMNGRKYIFTDLCGHEKYLRTTLFGLNLVRPDYCLIVIGGNMGVTKMTIEHLLVASCLGYKLIICITKIDIAPEHVLNNTIQKIKDILDKNKKEYQIVGENLEETLYDMNKTPIIKLSNVNGTGIPQFKKILKMIPNKRKYNPDKSLEMYIDDYYNLKGKGLIISATINKGILNCGDQVAIGTEKNSEFNTVLVKSIRDDEDISREMLKAGQSCTMLIKNTNKKTKKINIRRGMVVCDLNNIKKINKFKAIVFILNHQTTISDKRKKKTGYQPIIHCNGIRQAAEILSIKNKGGYLRSQERAEVIFQFVHHSEYLTKGSKFIFREGTTRGIGKVLEIL